MGKAIPGWQAVLRLLLASRQSDRPADMDSEVRSAAAKGVVCMLRAACYSRGIGIVER